MGAPAGCPTAAAGCPTGSPGFWAYKLPHLPRWAPLGAPLLGFGLTTFVVFMSEKNRYCAIPLGVIIILMLLYRYIEGRQRRIKLERLLAEAATGGGDHGGVQLQEAAMEAARSGRGGSGRASSAHSSARASDWEGEGSGVRAGLGAHLSGGRISSAWPHSPSSSARASKGGGNSWRSSKGSKGGPSGRGSQGASGRGSPEEASGRGGAAAEENLEESAERGKQQLLAVEPAALPELPGSLSRKPEMRPRSLSVSAVLGAAESLRSVESLTKSSPPPKRPPPAPPPRPPAEGAPPGGKKSEGADKPAREGSEDPAGVPV